MKYILIITGLLMLFFTSCKKEDIEVKPEYGETPIFTVDGVVDGQSISLQAGVDNAFLSTYITSVNGVNRFSGKLEKGDSYIDFGIFDGNLFAANSSIIQAGNSLMLSATDTSELFRINKAVCTNSALINSLEIRVNNVYAGESLIIYEPGIYNICVLVSYFDGSSKEVCNEVIIGYNDLAKFNIEYSFASQGILSASTSSSLSKTHTNWYVDGVLISSNVDFNTYLTPGLHVLKAEVTFSNGAKKSRSIIVDSDAQGRYFEQFDEFKTQLSAYMYQDFKAEFKVKIGSVIYEHVSNSSVSQFNLNSISNYGKSPNGNDVIKISGSVITEMRNMSTQQIVNAQFNIVLGVEIP